MLIEFHFKNVLSFRDEQVFSLVASSDKTLENNAITVPALRNRKILRSVVVYGPNASGKSNLLAALRFVKTFVCASAERPHIGIQPFRLDENSGAKPSEFEVTFIHKGVRYQYGFAVDQERVHAEWLIAYPKGQPQKWFERQWDAAAEKHTWHFGAHLKGEKEKILPLTRSNALFLSVATRFNHPQLTAVYEWFDDSLRIIDADTDSHFCFTAKQASSDNACLTQIRNLMQIADLGVIDVSVGKMPSFPDDMPLQIRQLIERGELEWNGAYEVQLHHRTQPTTSTRVPFSLEDESKGTQRLFSLSGPWLDTLQKGFTLIVDELGSSLHPLLARELIGMFHNPELNTYNAQLIFNTHDTSLLDAELFRRDQIWLVEKDNSGTSHLYPMLDYSPRKDESLAKGYMRGRYGAIPILGNVNILKGNGANGKT